MPPAVSSIKNETCLREVVESQDNGNLFENQGYVFQEANDKLESAKALISAIKQAAEAVALGELDSGEAGFVFKTFLHFWLLMSIVSRVL